MSDSDQGRVVVRLTEVEAYGGQLDPGSHAYRGRTPRNAVMFGPAGHAYVYFVYGMHWCLNVACGPDGEAAAVLFRAGEVVAGHELAMLRRPACRKPVELASGPARLSTVLGVDAAYNGMDLTKPDSRLRLESGSAPVATVRVGPRVGVAAGADLEWRFWLAGAPTVSAYRAHTRQKRL